MENLSVRFLEGRLFEASARNHKFIIDLPLGSKGKDAGPTPPELFVMSLASCVGMYVVFYCEKAGLDPAGLTISADYEKLPERITKISVKFSLPSAESDGEKKEALTWAEKCLIHNTLLQKPEIEITLDAL